MSIYLPNFSDSRVVAFCGSNGVDMDGFYKSLLTATGKTGGQIDDLWALYLTNKYGYYNGLHINGYENENTFSFTGNFTTHNMVSFDGTNDWLYYPGGVKDPALVDGRYVTIAFKITPRKAAGTLQTVLSMFTSNGTLQINTSNQINFQFSSASLSGLRLTNNGAITTAMTTGSSYIYHFAFDCLYGSHTVNAFCNGVTAAHNISFNASQTGSETKATLSATGKFVIGNSQASTTASSTLQADLGFFYLTVGDTTASYITDPAKFCYPGGHDIALGSDGSLPSGTQPIIFFGGSHTAADWNVGTNFGSGGATYTMNPDGVV